MSAAPPFVCPTSNLGSTRHGISLDAARETPSPILGTVYQTRNLVLGLAYAGQQQHAVGPCWCTHMIKLMSATPDTKNPYRLHARACPRTSLRALVQACALISAFGFAHGNSPPKLHTAPHRVLPLFQSASHTHATMRVRGVSSSAGWARSNPSLFLCIRAPRSAVLLARATSDGCDTHHACTATPPPVLLRVGAVGAVSST